MRIHDESHTRFLQRQPASIRHRARLLFAQVETERRRLLKLIARSEPCIAVRYERLLIS